MIPAKRLYTLARLMRATFTVGPVRLGPIPPGWVEVGAISDKRSGFDATAYLGPRGDEIVVCIRGQEVYKPRGLFADLRAVIVREFYRRTGRDYWYPRIGYEWVIQLMDRWPSSTAFTLVGTSGGCGWAAEIDYVIRSEGGSYADQLKDVVAIEGGARSLWTNHRTNSPYVHSVEVVDGMGEGSNWGQTPIERLGDHRYTIIELEAQSVPAEGRARNTYLHFPFLGVIDALEHILEKGEAA